VNTKQAAALVMYLQRGHGIVPTTGAEWSLVQGALSTIEGVANSIIEIEVRPANAVAISADRRE
jgi:hypothetical protein